jgi:predicted peptidase
MLGALILAPLVRSVEAQQETGFLNRVVSVSGRPVWYQVYGPVDFTPEQRLPVILFLHGGAQRGTDGVRQTQTGLGTAIRQTEYPGIGHNSWDPAFSDLRLWRWLLQQRKGQ